MMQLQKKFPSFISMVTGDPRLYGLINSELVSVMKEVVTNAPFMYPSASGLVERFKETVANFEYGKRGVKYESEKIIPTTGLASALYLLQSAVLKPGDEIALFTPNHYFFGPSNQVEAVGASLRSIETYEEDGWLPRPEKLREAMSIKTRFLMVVNPQNPLGVVYPERTLKEICDIAAEFSVPVISDEIYGLITYDGTNAHSTAKFAGENLVLTLSGASKIFFATGLRVGYICPHGGTKKNQVFLESLKKTASLFGQTSSGIATPILAALIEMYSNRMHSVDIAINELQRRRDFAVKQINEIEGISMIPPLGALYTFPKIADLKGFADDYEFLYALARDENVGLLPGSLFGDTGGNHVRGLILPDVSVQTEAYERIRRFLKRSRVT